MLARRRRWRSFCGLLLHGHNLSLDFLETALHGSKLCLKLGNAILLGLYSFAYILLEALQSLEMIIRFRRTRRSLVLVIVVLLCLLFLLLTLPESRDELIVQSFLMKLLLFSLLIQ